MTTKCCYIGMDFRDQMHSKETIEKMRQAKLGEKNPFYGKKHSEEAIEKTRQAKIAEKNPRWMGYDHDFSSLSSLHAWVRSRLPEPEFCDMCHKVPPYDLANITGRYTRDLDNWAYYCRRCHMISDGRLERFRSAWRDRA